nr:FxDxF family PEP-CTERM protein [uncultured Duganella sp.]
MKMFSKSVFAAAVLATSLVSQFASAADLPPSSGTIPVLSQPLPLLGDSDGWAAHFGNTFIGNSVINKNFTDRYTFSVGGSNLTTGSLTAKPLKTQDLYVSSFNVFTAAGTLVVQGINDNANSNHTGLEDNWKLPVSIVGAGDYYLEVTGQVLGKNSSYGAEMTLTPVPEAETYAMMMAGLGLVGFVARRRAAKKAA